MSTRPFKDIEQMMKAASEDFEQPFEESAWQKMEVLLDDEKDRRRPFFWLWWLLPVFIGAGIGGYFIFNKAVLPTESITTPGSKNITLGSTPAPNNVAAVKDRRSQSPVNIAGSGSNVQGPVTNQKNNNTAPATIRNRGLIFVREPDRNTLSTAKRTNLIAGKSQARIQVKAGGNMAVASLGKQQTNVIGNTPPVTPRAETNIPVERALPADAQKPEVAKLVPQGNDTLPSVEKNNNKKIRKHDNNSRWYVLVAGGAEGSSPRVFSVDKISAKGGVTIGYQLNKNLSLQTGFFAGSKKYIAGPKDYKAKAGSYWSTVDIVEVEANCLVLEIPLDIRYDLHPEKSTNIFTTAGLSSYIMSKEDYEYLYNRYGYQHYVKAGYTGNQHIMAVLRLSAGIEKNISKTLSLNAAPALSVPLAGVGEGQVKLYSTEFMVGLKYQPLKKIKHK